MLKRSRLIFILALSAALVNSAGAINLADPQEGQHGNKHGFGVKQYDAFHDILHPLEHEALPSKDFRRIRAKAAQLASRGRVLVRLGVPRGTSADNRAEFARELKKF